MKRVTRKTKKEQKDMASLVEKAEEESSQSEKPSLTPVPEEDNILLKSLAIPREEIEKVPVANILSEAKEEEEPAALDVENETTEELPPVPQNTPEDAAKKKDEQETKPDAAEVIDFEQLQAFARTMAESCPRHERRLIVAYDKDATAVLNSMIIESSFLSAGLVVLLFGLGQLTGALFKKLLTRK